MTARARELEAGPRRASVTVEEMADIDVVRASGLVDLIPSLEQASKAGVLPPETRNSTVLMIDVFPQPFFPIRTLTGLRFVSRKDSSLLYPCGLSVSSIVFVITRYLTPTPSEQ